MADPKAKPKSKAPSEPPSASAFWALLFAIIIGIYLIGQGFSYILVLLGLKDKDTGLMNQHAVQTTKIAFAGFLSTFQAISLFICLLFILGMIYTKFRVYEMKRMDKVRKKVAEISEKKIAERPEPNKKWLKVQEHVNSSNPSDWRLAILEADIMLNEILEKMGYKGMTIGDKLKTIEQSDFTNLDAAWEAHKVRNSIAHQGSDFNMNQKEAKRVISLYEKVFTEFYFI